MNQPANYINHIGLVLDASSSMRRRKADVIKVADNQIAYLAQRSKELDQETRVTVYSFSYHYNIKCLVYDKDVLRMPSIAALYEPNGQTALRDATLLAIDDLKLTPEKYGEHAFLLYVLTDGIENDSRSYPGKLSTEIACLPDHWTVATFVPDQTAVFEAKKHGFPAGNIAVWDATTAAGVEEAGERIRQTSETFMQNRTVGIRGSRSLFALADVSTSAVKRAIPALTEGSYLFLSVPFKCRVDEFIAGKLKRPYRIGEAYYELTKAETIQPQKNVAILVDGKVHTGRDARQLLGLPDDHAVRVRPSSHAFRIFVQSTSLNRHLMPSTDVLVMR